MKQLLKYLQSIKAFFIRIVIVRLIQYLIAVVFAYTIVRICMWFNISEHPTWFFGGFSSAFIIYETEKRFFKK